VGVGDKSAGTEGDASKRGRTRRWVGAGLAVGVVVIVVFAVAQGGGSDRGPLNAIAKAAEVTQREPGGHALIHASVTSSISSEGVAETGSMVFDESGRARGTVTVENHKTGREAELLVVVDGTTTYTSSDLFESLPGGAKWMELDLSSAVNDSGSAVPADGGPEEGLKILERVRGAEEIGKEDVNGVPTTHYRGTLPAVGEVFGVKLHVSALNIDVWIDAQGRVRRTRIVASGAVSGELGSTTTEMTIDFVDFGRVPKIELPNPDEVFNATSELESKVQSATQSH
jgi:hypothetical protein